jgi:hypothetical protein
LEENVMRASEDTRGAPPEDRAASCCAADTIEPDRVDEPSDPADPEVDAEEQTPAPEEAGYGYGV